MPTIFRYAFFLALAFTFVMAILPRPPQLPGAPSDKLQHILAFATLAGLGAVAFSRLRLWRLVAGLALLGGLIEVIQAIPALHRDSEAADFLADVLAAALAGAAARWAMRRGNS